MHRAALVDGEAEAVAHPEQREAGGVAAGAVGAFGDGGEIHVVVDVHRDAEGVFEVPADALLAASRGASR